jgi:hypothetical protein
MRVHSKIVSALAGVALSLLSAAPALAAGTDVSFTADTNINLSGPGITLVITSGSKATSYSVSTTALTLNLDTGSSGIVKSSNFYVLPNNLGLTTLCAATYTYLNLTSSSGPITLTITPTVNVMACSSPSSGGGGGGPGGINPTPPPTPTPAPTPTPTPSPSPPGQQPSYGIPPRNVSHNDTIYLVDGVNLRPYTSAAAFLSYSFNRWKDVKAATSADLALPIGTFVPPRNGSLINDHGTIYIITNGQRAGFTSAKVFKGLGYSFGVVIAGDTSFLTTLSPINSSVQAHLQGTLVKNRGTLWSIGTSIRIGIPNMSILSSWGLKASEAVKANSFDLVLPSGSPLQTRTIGQFGI